MELTIFLIALTVLNICILCSINWRDNNWWGLNKAYEQETWTRDDLLELDGFGFEDWCAELFEKAGYKVTQTPRTCDGGKDLILKDKKGERIYIECKRYTNEMIGRELCQKLIGACCSDGISRALFITTSLFHQNANDYMCEINKNSSITLDFMDCADLLEYANKVYANPQIKYEHDHGNKFGYR